MPTTLSHQFITIIAGTVIAVGLQALTAAGGTGAAGTSPASTARAGAVRAGAGAVQDGAVQDGVSAATQAATVRYWTPGRMAAALRPAGGRAAARRAKAAPGPWLTGDTGGRGLRWRHRGAVAAAVGKVFFTLDGEDYVCSGTLIGGKRADVVLTAAHCVVGGSAPHGAADWATNWVFVPGFRDGRMPYGEYTARRFFVAPRWTGPSGGSEQYDVAFVRITPATLYGGSGPASPPPGLPVGFAASQDAAPADRVYVFGYPSLPPYAGLHPDYCAGPATMADGSMRTACGMTAGDSGGPWLARFSPVPGTGTVVAVSTYKVSDNLSVLYGALLGPQARSLYSRASA